MKIDNELEDLDKTINEIQQQIVIYKNCSQFKDSEKMLKEMRDDLIFKSENEKRYWKYREEVSKLQAEEISKTIFRKNECIHYKVVDYFNCIPVTNIEWKKNIIYLCQFSINF